MLTGTRKKKKNILFPSTSIFNETGLVTSRNRLIAEILKNLEILYNDIINEEAGITKRQD